MILIVITILSLGNSYNLPRPVVWVVAGVLFLFSVILAVIAARTLARRGRSRSNEEADHEYIDNTIMPPQRQPPAPPSKAADIEEEDDNYTNMELTKV